MGCCECKFDRGSKEEEQQDDVTAKLEPGLERRQGGVPTSSGYDEIQSWPPQSKRQKRRKGRERERECKVGTAQIWRQIRSRDWRNKNHAIIADFYCFACHMPSGILGTMEGYSGVDPGMA